MNIELSKLDLNLKEVNISDYSLETLLILINEEDSMYDCILKKMLSNIEIFKDSKVYFYARVIESVMKSLSKDLNREIKLSVNNNKFLEKYKMETYIEDLKKLDKFMIDVDERITYYKFITLNSLEVLNNSYFYSYNSEVNDALYDIILEKNVINDIEIRNALLNNNFNDKTKIYVSCLSYLNNLGDLSEMFRCSESKMNETREKIKDIYIMMFNEIILKDKDFLDIMLQKKGSYNFSSLYSYINKNLTKYDIDFNNDISTVVMIESEKECKIDIEKLYYYLYNNVMNDKSDKYIFMINVLKEFLKAFDIDILLEGKLNDNQVIIINIAEKERIERGIKILKSDIKNILSEEFSYRNVKKTLEKNHDIILENMILNDINFKSSNILSNKNFKKL